MGYNTSPLCHSEFIEESPRYECLGDPSWVHSGWRRGRRGFTILRPSEERGRFRYEAVWRKQIRLRTAALTFVHVNHMKRTKSVESLSCWLFHWWLFPSWLLSGLAILLMTAIDVQYRLGPVPTDAVLFIMTMALYLSFWLYYRTVYSMCIRKP